MTDYRRRERKVPKNMGTMEDHQITEQEKQNWQMSKQRKRSAERPKLTENQKRRFLELIVNLSSPIYFDKELGLSLSDIEFYKKELKIESPDEARTLLRQFSQKEDVPATNPIKKAKEIYHKTQEKFDQWQRKKEAKILEEREKNKPDIKQVKEEYIERQKRLDKQQAVQAKGKSNWQLPQDGTTNPNLFKHEIETFGLNFCVDKYNVSREEIKNEAIRLKLKINWDLIK